MAEHRGCPPRTVGRSVPAWRSGVSLTNGRPCAVVPTGCRSFKQGESLWQVLCIRIPSRSARMRPNSGCWKAPPSMCPPRPSTARKCSRSIRRGCRCWPTRPCARSPSACARPTTSRWPRSLPTPNPRATTRKWPLPCCATPRCPRTTCCRSARTPARPAWSPRRARTCGPAVTTPRCFRPASTPPTPRRTCATPRTRR